MIGFLTNISIIIKGFLYNFFNISTQFENFLSDSNNILTTFSLLSKNKLDLFSDVITQNWRNLLKGGIEKLFINDWYSEEGVEWLKVSDRLLAELIPDTWLIVGTETIILLGNDDFNHLISNSFITKIIIFIWSLKLLLNIFQTNTTEFRWGLLKPILTLTDVDVGKVANHNIFKVDNIILKIIFIIEIPDDISEGMIEEVTIFILLEIDIITKTNFVNHSNNSLQLRTWDSITITIFIQEMDNSLCKTRNVLIEEFLTKIGKGHLNDSFLVKWLEEILE